MTLLWIPFGLLYANLVEWVLHRYVLHGVGKRKGSFWRFHWSEHHRVCRKNGNRDPDYDRFNLGWDSQGKEALGLVLLLVLHLPVLLFSHTLYTALAYATFDYLRKHRKCHQDPEWGRKHLPWHYDHHMGKDQDCNWGVTHDWWDRILGTRKTWPRQSP